MHSEFPIPRFRLGGLFGFRVLPFSRILIGRARVSYPAYGPGVRTVVRFMRVNSGLFTSREHMAIAASMTGFHLLRGRNVKLLHFTMEKHMLGDEYKS